MSPPPAAVRVRLPLVITCWANSGMPLFAAASRLLVAVERHVAGGDNLADLEIGRARALHESGRRRGGAEGAAGRHEDRRLLADLDAGNRDAGRDNLKSRSL